MFNEIYKKGQDSAGRVSFPDKTRKSACYRLFCLRLTIANPEYMFNFRIELFDKALISSLMSYANHPYALWSY